MRLLRGRGSAEVRGSVVPLRPETTPDPTVMRWVIPDGLLPFTGGVSHVPGTLQALLDEGMLAEIVVAPGAVLTMLSPGFSWVDAGATVRTALTDALGRPGSWEPDSGAQQMGPDAALAAAAQDIVDAVVAPFAASHGGQVRIGAVKDGIVDLHMEGACEGCPAAIMTATARFERRLKRRCPWLREVRLS